MGLTLSSSRSSLLEPVRKNRFVIQFDSVPGNEHNAKASENLAFACKSSDIPNFTVNKSEHMRFHERFKVANRPEFNDLNIVFYDYVNAAEAGSESVGQILYNWYTNIYDPLTGQMHYKKHYSTNSILAQLDPAGAIFRMWNIFYIWPTEVKFGDGLDAESDDLMQLEATFTYDFALKSRDTDPSQ